MSEPKQKSEDKDEEEIEEKETAPKTADAQDQAKALKNVQVSGKERQLDDTKVNQVFIVFFCFRARPLVKVIYFCTRIFTRSGAQ